MIAADMLDFVQDDLVTFGLAIIGVMVLMLALIFRDYRWVVTPIIACSLSALIMLGILGFTDWRMTIISSNFVAVLLVVSLALAIHLVVRYRELEVTEPELVRAERAVKAAELMFVPCFYTAVTTMVAFTSLVVAGAGALGLYGVHTRTLCARRRVRSPMRSGDVRGTCAGGAERARRTL